MKEILREIFDKGFYNYQGVGQLLVPAGWFPTYDENEGRHRPEYYQQVRNQDERVKVGEHSAAFQTTYACMDAALAYRTSAIVGVSYIVTAQGQYYSGNGAGGGMALRVGIDPFGGVDHTNPEVVWGDWYGQYQDWDGRSWHQYHVQTQAKGDHVTVLLMARNDHAAHNNHAWWDDVRLVVDLEAGDGGDGEMLQAVLEVLSVGLQDLADRTREIAAQLGALRGKFGF